MEFHLRFASPLPPPEKLSKLLELSDNVGRVGPSGGSPTQLLWHELDYAWASCCYICRQEKLSHLARLALLSAFCLRIVPDLRLPTRERSLTEGRHFAQVRYLSASVIGCLAMLKRGCSTQFHNPLGFTCAFYGLSVKERGGR